MLIAYDVVKRCRAALPAGGARRARSCVSRATSNTRVSGSSGRTEARHAASGEAFSGALESGLRKVIQKFIDFAAPRRFGSTVHVELYHTPEIDTTIWPCACVRACVRASLQTTHAFAVLRKLISHLCTSTLRKLTHIAYSVNPVQGRLPRSPTAFAVMNLMTPEVSVLSAASLRGT